MQKTKKKDKQESGPQAGLKNAAESVPGDNRNQNHNAKKEGLGPNTKR